MPYRFIIQISQWEYPYSTGWITEESQLDCTQARIFLLSIVSRPALGPIHVPTQWVPELTQPGPETGHTLPSSFELKNGGAIPPLLDPSLWLGAYLIKHRSNFNFFCLYLLSLAGVKYSEKLFVVTTISNTQIHFCGQNAEFQCAKTDCTGL
jgi:hypothetical protein